MSAIKNITDTSKKTIEIVKKDIILRRIKNHFGFTLLYANHAGRGHLHKWLYTLNPKVYTAYSNYTYDEFGTRDGVLYDKYPESAFDKLVNGSFILHIDKATYIYVHAIKFDKESRQSQVYIFGKYARKYLKNWFEFLDKERSNKCLTPRIRFNQLNIKGELVTEFHNTRSIESMAGISGYMDEISSYIDGVLAHNRKMEKHGIVMSPSMLLFGVPGTGKSTLIRAIALKYDYGICRVRFAQLSILAESGYLQENLYRDIIVFEDIDIFVERFKKESEGVKDVIITEDERKNYDTLMAILDGSYAPENKMFIATTNYIDKLEDRLIRDGRFDKHIEIKLMEREAAEDLCNVFECDNSILDNLEFPIKPGTVQKEIIQHCKNEFINSTKEE